MVKLNEVKIGNEQIPENYLIGKRHLTDDEIAILKKNGNNNVDSSWQNFYVSKEEGAFNPELIHSTLFSGFIILGKVQSVELQYNDLHLLCGIQNSRVSNIVVGDHCAIRDVHYLDNYILGERVILFNVQEMCCTNHAKFGNGILKEGEPEEHRVWIGVANENEGRAILPFEDMIPADAYLWSHYRDDQELLDRFKEMTEIGNTKKLDTIGFVGNDSVIKNSNIIKDTKVGECAYIKGAFKIKNTTILSSAEEVSQIGEGVELVNGILGYGSRVFYQAIAVRFVIGRNCQVKYGARVLNSVLGDNSTISCCEVLNNLIFPFHEQHHNSSFLIATTIMGQSNIAAGATIGSNHNSRSPDGEIFAKRGFWPGLCSDFKHNSRFASFVLVSKGSYQYELDIPYPFALVSPQNSETHAIQIIPAWMFMYDMFAITRNGGKFKKRDKRKTKIQNIEFDPLAPDTMQEILFALDRIIGLTAIYLKQNNPDYMKNAKSDSEVFQLAKDYLHKNPTANFVLEDHLCQKRYGATIVKPAQAYKMYRKIVKYYATKTIMEYCHSKNVAALNYDVVENIRKLPLYTEWENVGGQIMPSQKISQLFELIKSGSINDWKAVHQYYNLCECEYGQYKVRYALYLLEQLYSSPIEDFTPEIYKNILEDVTVVANEIYNEAFKSREKDYYDYYRNMTYRSSSEMENVIGKLSDNECLLQLKEETKEFVEKIHTFIGGRCLNL